MTEEKKEIELPMSSFVRGGTLTSAYEKQLAFAKADAEARRAKEDERQRLVQAHPDNAHQYQASLGGHRQHAAVVLVVKHRKDNVDLDYIICELIAQDDGTLMLVMACPSCAQRGIADNFSIKQANRHFELDVRHQGELWVNPKDTREIVTLAGKINLTEWTRCPNLGCSYRFKIDNSVLRSDE
jgi:hypothetical protein